MTYPWPWLNVWVFSGWRLARCGRVASMRITIFQGSPWTRGSALANCRACVFERLSSVVMASLVCACNIFEKSEGCRPEKRAASVRECFVVATIKKRVVYEGTMELSSRYTPHKQLLKRQTAISESFKHCR